MILNGLKLVYLSNKKKWESDCGLKQKIELEILKKRAIDGSLKLTDEQEMLLREGRILRNSDSLKNEMLRPNNNKVLHSVAYKIIRFWNCIPLEVRFSATKDIFKYSVTKMIYEGFFDSIMIV